MTFVTLNTIINDLLFAIRGATVSQSENISRRQIEDWVHQYRAVLLKRDLDKGKTPNPDFIQEIPFLELEQVRIEGTSLVNGYSYDYEGAYNPNVRTAGDHLVLRTKLELPKTLNLNNKSGFTFIGLPNGDELQYVPEGRTKLQQFKKYTPNEPLVYLKNNKLNLTNKDYTLTHLTVRGVFEVPTEVSRFINPATSLPYYNEDSKYPIPNDLLPVLKELILSKELRIMVTAPSDTKNDSNNGLSENSQR